MRPFLLVHQDHEKAKKKNETTTDKQHIRNNTSILAQDDGFVRRSDMLHPTERRTIVPSFYSVNRTTVLRPNVGHK